MREDFFQRIHLLSMKLPPLRHHKGDLPALVAHGLRQLTPSGASLSVIPSEFLTQFQAYDRPDNVRELFNELRRYLATGEVALARRLPALYHDRFRNIPVSPSRPFYEQVEALEKRLIADALAQTKGNKTRVAKQLHLPIMTLRRKMKKYDL